MTDGILFADWTGWAAQWIARERLENALTIDTDALLPRHNDRQLLAVIIQCGYLLSEDPNSSDKLLWSHKPDQWTGELSRLSSSGFAAVTGSCAVERYWFSSRKQSYLERSAKSFEKHIQVRNFRKQKNANNVAIAKCLRSISVVARRSLKSRLSIDI